MKLVIVESPAKAKTIEKYLGRDYIVDASGGHVRDLPEKAIGIDVKNNFKPEYVIYPKKQDVVRRLAGLSKKAEKVYLATDPDREGEAISWHLMNALGLDDNYSRIMFNEISKRAVNEAIEKPGKINMDLVNAQQARRILDRLVGYELSPVLCKKIQGKLSAGRVQSAALKLIVDRDREIKSFVKEEYWSVTAFLKKLTGSDIVFKAVLESKCGKKIKLENKEKTDAVLKELEGKDYTVESVKKSVTYGNPPPPFTTSTLQQESSTKLGMASNVTMQIAQQLYEGLDLTGLGHIALVTYIRTDSTRVSAEATAKARETLAEKYGEKYVPQKPNIYKSRKNSQDAHEAIRPINLELTPESLKDKLQRNQYRLYKLIYERFLASQAAKAVYDSVNVTIKNGDYAFKSTGKTMTFDGYTRIYAAAPKEEAGEDNEKIPPLADGEKLELSKLSPEQKFTKPPAKYTEASLIKLLEDKGIGRPSTFATILSTLYKREYIKKDGKSLEPTELGELVTVYLEKYFNDIVDAKFTARMEEGLDKIEEEGADWHKILNDFYPPFREKIKEALSGAKMDVVDEPSDVKCEKCGAMMVFKRGPYGKYLSCPECKTNKSLKSRGEEKVSDVRCEKCGAMMVEKSGKYGKYLACPNYPSCKNIKSVQEVVAVCPKCGGDVVKRFSKTGRIFYGCAKYPECDFVSWDVPAPIKCEKCGGAMVIKEGKTKTVYKCMDKNCGFTADAEKR